MKIDSVIHNFSFVVFQTSHLIINTDRWTEWHTLFCNNDLSTSENLVCMNQEKWWDKWVRACLYRPCWLSTVFRAHKNRKVQHSMLYRAAWLKTCGNQCPSPTVMPFYIMWNGRWVLRVPECALEEMGWLSQIMPCAAVHWQTLHYAIYMDVNVDMHSTRGSSLFNTVMYLAMLKNLCRNGWRGQCWIQIVDLDSMFNRAHFICMCWTYKSDLLESIITTKGWGIPSWDSAVWSLIILEV